MLLMLILCSLACCCYNSSFSPENNPLSTTAASPSALAQQASPSALAQQASPSASPVQPATQNNTFAFAPYLYTEPSSATGSSPNQIVQAAQKTSTKDYILAFIISSGCQAIWGDYTKAGQPPAGSSSGTADPMMVAINQLRQSGGDVAISFGGANGTELAQACTDVSSLKQQYQNIIDAYKITHLDFDIDSAAAVGDTASVDRRNKALAALEQTNSNLVVTYTLPVLPTGLTDGDVKLLQNTADNKVKVSVVNIMTMDYGQPDSHMGQDAISAAQATQKQVASTGLPAKIGITPMIGQNDSQGEIFSLDDARSLVAFAKQNSYVSMLSIWSLGRDKSCDTGAGGSASPTCSSISQQQYDFIKILGA
ncbi:MAG TPA: glycosyl hydrolase family 18 protein [Ktedonobacteraceae bacterium]